MKLKFSRIFQLDTFLNPIQVYFALNSTFEIGTHRESPRSDRVKCIVISALVGYKTLFRLSESFCVLRIFPIQLLC